MKNIYNAILGQLISAIGTQIFVMSVVLWLKRDFESPGLVGVFLSLSALPSLIMSPVSGTIADLFSRRLLMIICDIISGMLLVISGLYLLSVPSLDSQTQLFIIVTMTLLILIISDIFAPANNAYLSEAIPKNQIQKFFGIRASLLKSTQFIGQSMGGFLFLNLNIAGICILNGVSFLISAFMEYFLEKDKISISNENKNIFSYFHKVKEGFLISIQNKPLLFFFLGACITNGLSSICLGTFPYLVENILGFKIAYYPIIVSFIGVGAFTAGFTAKYSFLEWRKDFLIPMFLIFPGISFILVSFVNYSPILLMIWMFFNGFTFTTVGIYMFKIITTSFANTHRGRAFAILFSLSNALNPIGFLLSGLLSSHFIKNLPLIFSLIGLLIAMTWWLILMNSENRKFLIGK